MEIIENTYDREEQAKAAIDYYTAYGYVVIRQGNSISAIHTGA